MHAATGRLGYRLLLIDCCCYYCRSTRELHLHANIGHCSTSCTAAGCSIPALLMHAWCGTRRETSLHQKKNAARTTRKKRLLESCGRPDRTTCRMGCTYHWIDRMQLADASKRGRRRRRTTTNNSAPVKQLHAVLTADR